MSFRQIFDRVSRFARAHAPEFGVGRAADLHLAERLIEEERLRDERARTAGGAAGEEPDQARAAYLQAIRILAVADGASWEEIVAAYRTHIAVHHPDRTANLGAEEQRNSHTRAQELNMAYEFLGRYHGRR